MIKYNEHIKKLEEELSEARSDSDKNRILSVLEQLLSEYVKTGNLQKVTETAFELYPMYEKNNEKEKVANVLITIAENYAMMGNYEKEAEFSIQAKEIYEEKGNELSIAGSLRVLGNSLYNMGNFDESLSALFSAIEIYKKNEKLLKLPENKTANETFAHCLEMIGMIYGKLNQAEKSREYFFKALEKYEENDVLFGVAKCLNNIGVSYSKTDSQKTLEYYKKALSIAKKQKWLSFATSCTNNIGGVYEDIGELDEALKYYKEALDNAEKYNLKNKPYFLKFIGSIHLKKEEFELAIEFTERSLELFQKQNVQLEIQDNFKQLSNIYKKKKEYKKALDYHEKYSAVKEKFLNREIVEKISHLQEKFDESNKKIIELKKYHSLISKTLKKSMNRSFIGNSKKINEIMKLAMKAAKSRDTNVLITGESGTGKEIIAHLIHCASSRKDHLFVAINSSSVPESLAESEFFGHIKGAFTGAINNKAGYLEEANKGTLFLDEIAETPSQLQAKLLRVLENKKIKRLGSNNEIYVDFRIIAATNKKIDSLISKNKFRLDLLHRINTIEINIPPLRERPEDIKPLLYYFVEEFSKSLNKPIPKINVKVIDKLKKYQFPGNVRELKNMVEKALILYNTDTLEPEDFNTGKTIIEKSAEEIMKPKTIEEMKIQMILDALKKTNNNHTRAARLLGISHSTFLRKLKEIEK